MKPAPFEYIRPRTISEALNFLQEYGDEAKIISGGQSLMPLLNMRLSTPNYLIDISRIEELRYLKEEEGKIVIGANVKQAAVERSGLVSEKCGLLHEAIKHVGHKQIRNRGTVVGSVAHGDPSAEIPCVLTALRGEIVIANADEERVVEPREFFITHLLTALEPHELVKEVRFPCLSPTSGYAFCELARRKGDFALVAVAAVLDLDDEGKISKAMVAVGGASPVPTVLEEVEEHLLGQAPSEQLFQTVAKGVAEFIEPESDVHGSAEYRRQLAVVLTKRALIEAANKVSGRVAK